jgi:2-enoate reductase
MAGVRKAAKYLQDAGYDMLNCDNGTYDAWYWAHPAGIYAENCNLEDVEHIKKFVSIPVVCAGRMDPKVAANNAIKEGKLDGMGVARQFLADPAWVTKTDGMARRTRFVRASAAITPASPCAIIRA